MALNSNCQAQLSIGQVSQLWTGLRRLSAGLSHGNGKTQPNIKRNESRANNKDSVPGCVSLLREIQLDPLNLSVISPQQSQPLRAHWRESHRSEDSFHKNIHGARHTVDVNVQEVCMAVFGTKTLRLSADSVRDVMFQQTRGFKTKRSGTTGIGGARTLGKIDTMKVPASSITALNSDSDMNRRMLGKENDKKIGINKITSSYNLTPEEEKELKLSFAEGFHSASDWRKLSQGLINTMDGNSNLKVQAFSEGYKSNLAANMSQGQSKSGIMSKVMTSIISSIIFFCIIAAVLLMTSNVSIRKVQLFNGEQFEVNPETVTVTFDDIRGSDEAKAELNNVVDFLKNPTKYTDLGAKLPNGVLLVGPPGVGKTLLAKAVAGEAGVPFFQASGAEFDEVYVGTGAKRVRQLFQAAKAKAPCVIFIDEIDSVGGKRSSSEMHPYANQTVNQLLTEMDGFQSNEGVIVLGATNKRNNLDKALLRPGRFDVEVSISVPDLLGRQEILALYLPKLKTDGSVEILTVAKQTTGCTGADLYNICNHAAMKAATDGETVVTMRHVEHAIDKVRMGPQKKRLVEPIVNRCTAYHEAGHALIQFFSKVNSSKLHKITILPRGQSLGMTHFIHEEKREFQYTKEEMLDDLDSLMGGRIAEELTFGDNQVSTGASNDMERASSIAENMVMRFGFSEKIGLRVRTPDANHPISEKLQEEIDEEIKRILKESYDRAKKLLISHQKQLVLLAEALIEYEELSFKEAKIIIEGGKIDRPGRSKPPPQQSDGGSKRTTTNISPSTTQIKPVKL